ncbi:MAG: hypothetical protein JXB48_10760 [Candidatus Latescibacteria bacterium]|nr:hypothetical protein [Candidatus Latescibacterota bacterium]
MRARVPEVVDFDEPEYLLDLHDKYNYDKDSTPIKRLVLKYEKFGLSHRIANLLIGRSESETEENITMFDEMMQRAIKNAKETGMHSKKKQMVAYA